MKKRILILAGMAVAAVLAVSGCGKKTAETTAAATTAATNAVEDNDNSIDVVITSLADGKLSGTDVDGKTVTADISGAVTNPAWELAAGDEVNLYYQGEEFTDGTKVDEVEMVVPFEFSNEQGMDDLSLYGEVTELSKDSISVKQIFDGREQVNTSEQQMQAANGEYGDTYTFSIPSYATIFSKADLKQGDAVSVSYTGDLKSAPVAYWIVNDDMADEEAAQTQSITGTVDKVDQNVIYLLTEDQTSFKFMADDDAQIQTAKDNIGKKVRITFDGTLRYRVVSALTITPES